MPKIVFQFLIASITVLPLIAEAKYRVCTATINSREEADVFRSRLNHDDFDFVELTDYTSDKIRKTDDWFERACEAGVQCDVLIISGHFGGQFFGISKFTLGLKELDKSSCQKSCPGILNHPKEVYLFGCNTLATKDKDHRDEASYVEVLVNDGIDRPDAVRRAAERYGPFGSSFKDQVERSFEGVPFIYGFSSVGPSGANVKKSLTQYLRKIGNFKTHLDNIETLSPEKSFWLSILKPNFPAAIGKGLLRSHRLYTIKENACWLSNDAVPVEKRVERAQLMLDRDLMTFLPSVSAFVNEKLNYHTYQQPSDTFINHQVDALRTRDDLKGKVLNLAHSSTVTFALRADFFLMAKTLYWIDEEQFKMEMTNIINPLIKNPTRANADQLCSILEDKPEFSAYVDERDLAAYSFSSIPEYSILDCTESASTDVHRRAVQSAERLIQKKLSIMDLYTVLSSLKKAPPEFNSQILRIGEKMRNYRGPFQNELAIFLDMTVLRRGAGALQINLAKKIFTSSSTEYMNGYVMYLLQNSKIEFQSIQVLFERLIRLGPNEQSNLYLSNGEFLKSKEIQDYIASLWPRLSDNLKGNIAYTAGYAGVGVTNALSSQMLDFALAVLGQDQDNSASAMPPLSVLAKSNLSQSQLAQVQQALEKEKLKTQYSITSEFLRNILFQHAKRGLWEMNDDLRTGDKKTWKCRPTGSMPTICTAEFVDSNS